MPMNHEGYWNDRARKMLLGHRVTAVSYLTAKETERLGWDRRSLAITFDNGVTVFAAQDDEGNGPGALFTSDKDTPILPVLR